MSCVSSPGSSSSHKHGVVVAGWGAADSPGVLGTNAGFLSSPGWLWGARVSCNGHRLEHTGGTRVEARTAWGLLLPTSPELEL